MNWDCDANGHLYRQQDAACPACGERCEPMFLSAAQVLLRPVIEPESALEETLEELGLLDPPSVESLEVVAFEDIPEGAPVALDLTLGLVSRLRGDDGEPLG